MAYELNNSFSVCFNIMKIKYSMYDNSFGDLNMITPFDSINVFISMESVLHYLSNIYDLDKKIVSEKECPIILTSDLLNLAAHYKRFFRDAGLETRVFLYMTDLDSETFYENDINEDYRSYYLNKFNSNPRISPLTEYWKYNVLPDAMKIAEFIPNVYIINAKNIDSGVVPMIIAEKYPGKNVMITSDIFDTQYSFFPGWAVHYIRKTPLYSNISWNLRGYLKEIFKRDADQTTEVNLFANQSFYTLLLSVIGDKLRSIEPIRRIGSITLMKMIRSGIKDGLINYGTDSIELIKRIFPEDMQDDIKDNFIQFSIRDKFQHLSDKDKFDVLNQIIDRFDNNSLLRLNGERFYNHQIMLSELTM